MKPGQLALVLAFTVLASESSIRAQTDNVDIGPAPVDPVVFTGQTEAPPGEWEIWYRQPAHQWLDAMPLGNGNMGAMAYGGVNFERIGLNEVTCWSGEEADSSKYKGAEALPALRAALLKGDLKEGMAQMEHMNQNKAVTGNPGTHLPVGDLFLDFTPPVKECSDYRRELDLERSLATVSYRSGGVTYTREYFISNPDKVLVVRLSADRPKAVSFKVSTTQYHPLQEPVTRIDGHELVLAGQALETHHSNGKVGVHFQTRIKVLNEGGTVTSDGNAIQVEGADAVTLLVSITTDFRGFDYVKAGKARIAAAAARPYAQLLKDHIADVRSLFDRVGFDLGVPGQADKLPTDERLAAFKADPKDQRLAALFFQFGRYLTFAGSRPDSRLPMPLQGLWCDGRSGGWSDDYHLDVNTEQNYWACEVGNLAECTKPLFDFIERLRMNGRNAAKLTWGSRGWVAHITANAWASSPFAHHGGPTMGTWQATHLWEHYAFGQDKKFLADVAYPTLKENAEFFLGVMITDPKTGWLVTCPAYSPENGFPDPATGQGRITETLGNTGDTEVIYELFRECIEASRILGIDEDFRKKLETAQAQLPPQEKLISPADGRLMEWFDPAYADQYPSDKEMRGNRSTHHLLGLFPFDELVPQKNPVLAKAARLAVEDREAHLTFQTAIVVNSNTEWTLGNFMHFWARFGEGDKALGELENQIKYYVPGESLMTVSWWNIFCLDGNTSATSGMAEMLLQSHSGEISLLPALPTAWPDGSIRGLRARGGFEVAMEWHAGTLTKATLLSTAGNACRLRATHPVAVLLDNQPVETRKGDDGVLEFSTLAGKTYTIQPEK